MYYVGWANRKHEHRDEVSAGTIATFWQPSQNQLRCIYWEYSTEWPLLWAI